MAPEPEFDLYRRVLRAASAPFLLLNRDLTIADASDAYLGATGTSRDIIGRYVFDVFPDDPADPAATGTANLTASFEAVLRTRAPHRVSVQRYPIPRPDGGFEERFWSPVNSPVLDSRGEVAFILHHVEDVTAQVKHDLARRALGDAETERHRLKALLMEAPAAIALLHGPEHVYELANPLYRQLVGRADLLGKRGRDVLPELVAQGIWDLFDGVYASGETFVGKEFPVQLDRRGDGALDQGYFNFTAQAMRGADGKTDGILLFAIEVTAQVLARKALEDILAGVPVPIVLIEPHTARIFFSNKAADELWGGSFPKATSQADYRQYVLRDLQGRELPFDELPAVRASRGEVIQHYEAELETPRGRISLLIDSALVPELPGHPASVVITFQDVTELRQAVRVREEFLSIASHELNTPLAALKLLLGSLLRDKGADEKVLRRVKKADQQADRLARLVLELLEVTRITAGRLAMKPQAVDLGATLPDLIALVVGDGEEAASVTFSAPPGALASVDPARLEQVVTNLLTNAVKYGEGRPIEVTVAVEQTLVLVSVRDHGIGIDPEVQQRIFDRFERAVSVRHYGGFGLGLWIVRQIVEAWGGKVTVSSSEGKGSTFTFSLPRG